MSSNIKTELGSTFTFGSYRDNPIEWQVLAKEDNKVLIITKDVIEYKPYNTKSKDVTWETCTLRKWLNKDFYNSAFSSDEKAIIKTTNVKNSDNRKYHTYGGANTKDKIFLLSIDEANKYFSNNSDRLCQGSSNAKSNGLYVNDNGFSWWRLRSPGGIQYYAAYVFDDGSVDNEGNCVDYDVSGVRPALWISLD